jgi:DNA-binding GntR family transcriptional regulator
VVRDVVRGLYDGRYEPGQRLQEAQLTAAYGISRGPVREALNRLAAMGIVELTPQRGAQIRVLSVPEAIETLVVAQALISLAARIAASGSHSGPDRERLQAVTDGILAFPVGEDGAEFALARDSFYAALIALADNSELRRILPTVRIQLIRVQFRAVLQASDMRRRQDYRRIAEAIFAGRPADAEAAARNHLDRAITQLKLYLAKSSQVISSRIPTLQQSSGRSVGES